MALVGLILQVCWMISYPETNAAFDWKTLNLPDNHLPFYFNNKPELKQQCLSDANCPYKSSLNSEACFGYETNCTRENIFYPASCPEKTKWYGPQEQIKVFFESGDFGIIKEKKKEMTTICSSETLDGGFLMCEGHARYCRGQNIKLDLRNSRGTKSYDEDFLKPNEIGAKCQMDRSIIKSKWSKDHRNSLQSWYQVFEHFTELPDHKESHCDIVYRRPTYILQTDAEVNMFHHFCDFVNLYVSQHLNSTTFDMDVDFLIWDTSGRSFSDPFEATYKAFTINPVKSLGDVIGKSVCFKEVIFALPPRQRLGLFYNMPLVDGCYGTGLFRAFNEHIIHRLGIKQTGPLKDKIRITILSRKSQYRNILNEQELLEALNKNPKYEVRVAVYKFSKHGEDRKKNFLEQIQSTHNSDIFIGMHGAGLTHMLFQPHWAAVIELYHCDDPKCYSTLARLRGVKYLTWTNFDKLYPEDEGHHPTLGAHKKFTNYKFDVEEFLRLIHVAADHVRKHPEYRAAKRKLYKNKDEL